MDYFDFFHPPFSSLATIVANGLSVNQILLRRSPPFYNLLITTMLEIVKCGSKNILLYFLHEGIE